MARQYIKIPLHIWEIEELNVTERLTASIIHGYTEHSKICFMTNTGFSKLLRVSPRTISAAVNRLIDLGYVEELGGGSKRQLGWKPASMGVEASFVGGWKPASTRNNKINRNLNRTSIEMNDEIKNGEKKPETWQQVRDYFNRLDDNQGGVYRTHIVAWAKSFYEYYDSRQWQNKHGDITKWRPVATAWFNRSAEKAPRRAVKQVDVEALRRDLKWYQRRLDGYEARGKADLVHKTARAIHSIEQQIKQHEG
jgi:hypothetical protein